MINDVPKKRNEIYVENDLAAIRGFLTRPMKKMIKKYLEIYNRISFLSFFGIKKFLESMNKRKRRTNS